LAQAEQALLYGVVAEPKDQTQYLDLLRLQAVAADYIEAELQHQGWADQEAAMLAVAELVQLVLRLMY
jgi:hypothetical protein